MDISWFDSFLVGIISLFLRRSMDYAGHYLTVAKWRPNFRPAKETISSIAVWIRLPGLPLELFDEKILLRVAGMVGKPVKVHQTTTATKRGKFARICVELIY